MKIGKNIVFTCGSGVTASVLALAYSLIDNKYMPTIYDGSWSEYGKN
jgi:thiosulfate/3-mercaptopyruvate sulfurtransferase